MNTATLILLGIPVSIYRAWVLMTLWGWFVVPLGAPSIGMAWAYGLGNVYLVLHGYRMRSKEETEANESGEGVVAQFLYATICLGFGYVAWRVMR